MDKKGVSKKVICWIILISVLVILIVVLAFGLLSNKKDDTVDEYNPGVITMSYTDSNTFKFTNLVPLTDSLGKTSEQYFDFVVNTKLEDSDEINYEIAVSIIEDESNVTILNDFDYGYISKGSYRIFSQEKNERWNTIYKNDTYKISKKSEYYMFLDLLVKCLDLLFLKGLLRVVNFQLQLVLWYY